MSRPRLGGFLEKFRSAGSGGTVMDNSSRLLELVLYVSDQCMTEPDFGRVKLNKILFNADFSHFARTGESISRQDYIKKPRGPVVKQMEPILRDAVVRGDLVVKEEPRGAYKLSRVVALRTADLSEFTADEIATIDESINLCRGYSGRYLSDLSHDFLGWQLAHENEVIPYETIYLSKQPLTEGEEEAALRWPAAI